MGQDISSLAEPTGIKEELDVESGRWKGVKADSKVLSQLSHKASLATYKDKEDLKG